MNPNVSGDAVLNPKDYEDAVLNPNNWCAECDSGVYDTATDDELMTCCVGSFSAHLGNSKMIEFDSFIFLYSFNDSCHSSLLEYAL